MKRITTDCLFCRIARGEYKAHVIWEDEKHIAFLTPFPSTKGFSVVATKQHYSSYCFDLDDRILSELVIASKKVGKLLDRKLEDVGRTGLILEGFGIDHVHAKLFPMHGTGNMKEWKPIHAKERKFFERYEGYISSHDGDRMDEETLLELTKTIRE